MCIFCDNMIWNNNLHKKIPNDVAMVTLQQCTKNHNLRKSCIFWKHTIPLLRLSLDIRLNRVQNYAFDRITTGFMHYAVSLFNGQYKSSLLMIDWFSWWNTLVSLGFSFSPPWPPVSRDPRRWLGCISGIWKGLNRSHLGLLVVATDSFLWSRDP